MPTLCPAWHLLQPMPPSVLPSPSSQYRLQGAEAILEVHPHLETDFCPTDLFHRLLQHMYCVQMLGKPRHRTGVSLVVVEPRASLEHQTRLPEVWTHPRHEHLFALHIPWSPSTVSRHPEPFVGPTNRLGSSAQTSSPALQGPSLLF